MEIIAHILKNKKSPYAVLAASPGTGPFGPTSASQELRMAYLKLAVIVHPDKHRGSSEATEAFQVLIKAYEAAATTVKPSSKKETPLSQKKTSKPSQQQKAARKKKKQKGSDDDDTDEGLSLESDDDEEEITSSSEEEEDDLPLSRQSRIQKQTVKAADLEARNQNCFRTPVRCPRCGPHSVPINFDPKELFTLFMSSEYNYKIHCEGCLLQFGHFTALHYCPQCQRSAEYNAEKYNDQVQCSACKKKYGYMLFRVSQQALDLQERQQNQAAKSENSKSERDNRARGRRGVAEEDEDEEMTLLVGQCLVNEKCPLCGKTVKSGHRSHVETCRAAGTTKKVVNIRKHIVDDENPKAKRAPRKTSSSTKKIESFNDWVKSPVGKGKTGLRSSTGAPAAKKRLKKDSDEDDFVSPKKRTKKSALKAKKGATKKPGRKGRHDETDDSESEEVSEPSDDDDDPDYSESD